ncbi:MAG: dihydroorotate dehydrogenase [Thermodesulfovibrionales bacterium]|nr:dihydroorotate dehydrogenase [Thermodesulfovibrionales bacterium]
MNLSVKIGHLQLRNPVITASGTFGYGEEFAEYFDLSVLGAIAMKGISLEPREGNPPPRIWETPCGMLNSIGLQNVGLKRFLKEKLPFVRRFDVPVIANILGNSIDEYLELAKNLDGEVEAIELNISCPNVKKGGIFFGTDRQAMAELVNAVKRNLKKSLLITKLSPQADIKEFSKIAEDSGSDAISLINTIPAMAVDIETKRPVFKNITAGLSGPAIKPIALRMVWEAVSTVKIPVIGIGGIMTAGDALEFIITGAVAVEVGTANFIDPLASIRIIQGIEDYMIKRGLSDIEEIIGSIEI